MSKKAITTEIVSFVNYLSEINKTSITSLKLHNVNYLLPPSNYFVSQHDVLQIPPLSFALMCKMSPELENLYFFSSTYSYSWLNRY